MSEWSVATYGNPCRECGFVWSRATSDVIDDIATLPDRVASRTENATGDEQHPELSWSVTAYIAHVSDNLRIWAERIAGASRGGSTTIISYDENALATVRGYNALTLPGVLWSLERSVRDWTEVIAAKSVDLTLVHSERGVLQIDDLIRMPAHDAHHHEWDIRRTLALPR